MKFFCHRFLIAAAISYLPLVSADVSLGDTICVEGYVMDYYCIENVVLLDNPSRETLKYPE
jgi:hypothetical protein